MFAKVKNKTKNKTDKAQKKSVWFSPKNLISNFKTIKWISLKSGKDGKPGLLKQFFKIVVFMVIVALLFVGIDALISFVLTNAGLL